MTKYFVKKPFTALVVVIMIIVLGIVSFSGMTTDLLPAMELPYVMVVTTYPGASPEKVETAVTAPLEAALGTVNGVVTVSSSSKENVSMLSLEFENGTNMDSAMVKLSTAIDQVKSYLPDTAQNPMLMQISPDMLPVMIASIDMDDADLFELSEFAQDKIIPNLERQAGVASVTPTGLVAQSVEVRFDEAKIEDVNTRILAGTDDALGEARNELNKAQQAVTTGKAELEKGKKELQAKQEQMTRELADGSAQLDSAIAQAQSLASEKNTLEVNRQALEAERKGYAEGLSQLEAPLAQLEAAAGDLQKAKAGLDFLVSSLEFAGVDAAVPLTDLIAAAPLPDDVKASLNDGLARLAQAGILPQGATLNDAKASAAEIGAKLAELNGQLDQLREKKQSVTTRLEQIDTELANLSTKLAAAEMMAQQAQEGLKTAQQAYAKLEAGKMQAAAGFGAGSAQLAAAESALAQSEAQLKTADEQFQAARDEALKKADLNKLLTKDMISNLIIAQNLAMPAGTLYQDDDAYLLKIGKGFSDINELSGTVLMSMEGVGDIRLSDVAQVTLIDNAGESYAKVNGRPAVAVSIQKGSTASTSAVSKQLNTVIGSLEEKYPGLHITPLMDQGDYIKMTVNTVLSNLGWGAVLAILVLALFLKDIRPTAVVALSIPVSLLFAVVLMYFSGVSLNMISLSGLALGVGMLVDNSIVVMENIYRLRSEGMSAAKAAVYGARQVAGAISASTLTTVCVFLPILFTTGMTRQLFMDMGLTIGYSLLASLLVALTVVPTLGSTLLRSCREKPHALFDRMVDAYGKALDFCLRFKAVPLALSLFLFGLCVWHTTRMGLEFMPAMGGNQMSATLMLPEDCTKEDAFAAADQAMELIGGIDGVETVGAMGSGSMMGGLAGNSGDSVESMTFYLLLEKDALQHNDQIADEIEALEQQMPGCSFSVMKSNADMSALGGSGMELVVRGRDLDELNRISLDMIDLLSGVTGLEPASNGQEDSAQQLHLLIDRDAAMRCGLTAAQIYGELSAALTTSSQSAELSFENGDFTVTIVDERSPLTRDNLLDFEFETAVPGKNGETEIHRLGEFASAETEPGLAAISRKNQQRYITVSAATSEGYNTTLLSREVETLLAEYDLPEGCTVEITGETENVATAMRDLIKMILLAVTFIYLIMVAQFQSLLSPFIVMFTMPLAFTGGLGALWIAGEPLSVISMLGFLILAGIVVNNGIVFVDYANQLRLAGYARRDALISAGKARIRPILMTALTTILAMSVMVFSTGMGAEMSRPMALVTIGGLAYATLLTLFIVPVLYELLFRRELKSIDVGDETAGE